MWFQSLTGFTEKSPEQVRENLILDGEYLLSKINGKRFRCGRLETPTLQLLRYTPPAKWRYNGHISVSDIVADVKALHCDPVNENAMFQAASQFNLLEMVAPSVTPELGVDLYDGDHTQGPACAVACGAGTIYRNYFVDVNGETGQTAKNQIDCLSLIGEHLKNDDCSLWEMRNGYAMASMEGLQQINNRLFQMIPMEYKMVLEKLKIGIQWDTQVTISDTGHTVSQAYCSALPVAYSGIPVKYWEPFARMILEGTYRATFYAALKNYERTGCNKLFLTLVGGGAFGNPISWIIDAMETAIKEFATCPLDVRIVSYGHTREEVKAFVERFNS